MLYKLTVLSRSKISIKAFAWPISVGMVEVSLFLFATKYDKLVDRPISEGMGPVIRPLPSTLKFTRRGKDTKPGERVP